MAAPARRPSPYRVHFAAAAVLAAAGTLAVWSLLSRHNDWAHWLACWLLAVNVVSFGYYGFDKGRARAGARRVPEAVLHTLTAAGGSLGSYAGMRCFRHKTVKGTFRIVFWGIVVLQVLLALALAKRLWWD